MKRKTSRTIPNRIGRRVPVFKVLDLIGRSTIQRCQWPIPRGKRPGKWMKAERRDGCDELVICGHGLHLTRDPFQWYSEGSSVIYLAEYEIPRGEEMPRRGDKFCVYRARLIREVSAAEARRLMRPRRK